MTRLRICRLSLTFLFCAVALIAAPAQSIFFTTLLNFNSANGAAPYAGLVQGRDGNFYGTTPWGGANNNGTVYKITPAGTLTTLYSFCTQPNCTDGASPYAVLLQATDGNFYGTTLEGGDNNLGTIFKISSSGTFASVYSFSGSDGEAPYAGLIQATDGYFYGTTSAGGDWNDGTVFRITSNGTLITLHSFDSVDGYYPYAGLVQASDGNFYGTTGWGGAYGRGTVFKITPAGTLTTLYGFRGDDGIYPYAGLVQGTDGNFYGTTANGGRSPACPMGCGTVFKITSSGTLTMLHSFTGWSKEGAKPYAGLVQGRDGNFFGTTVNGGTCGEWEGPGCGTVFKITPSGTLTTLHIFYDRDGSGPYAGLVQASDGFFYGTTCFGGAYDLGTVFRIGVARACASCRP